MQIKHTELKLIYYSQGFSTNMLYHRNFYHCFHSLNKWWILLNWYYFSFEERAIFHFFFTGKKNLLKMFHYYFPAQILTWKRLFCNNALINRISGYLYSMVEIRTTRVIVTIIYFICNIPFTLITLPDVLNSSPTLTSIP